MGGVLCVRARIASGIFMASMFAPAGFIYGIQTQPLTDDFSPCLLRPFFRVFQAREMLREKVTLRADFEICVDAAHAVWLACVDCAHPCLIARVSAEQ